MRILLTVQPGEGGEDARQLCFRQAAIYQAYARKVGISCELESSAHS